MNNKNKKKTGGLLIIIATIIIALLTQLNKFGGSGDFSEIFNDTTEFLNATSVLILTPTTTTEEPTTIRSTTTTRKPTTTSRSRTTTRKPTTTRSTTTTKKPTTTRSTTTTKKPTTTRSTTTTKKPTTTRSTTTTRKPTTTRSTTTTARTTTTRKPTAGPALILTPFLNTSSQIEYAQSRAQVSHDEWTVESYAGYFTVNEHDNSNLFFWYFPAKVDSDRAPVVLYVEGDLGKCAAFSIFVRNGPLVVDSRQLVERVDSWHRNHNMLYIDTAVGSGFSFNKNTAYKSAWPLMQVGNEVVEAVHQFFKLFPNLQKNDFFVAGESFAAPLVATIANKIHKDKTNPKSTGRINLKGIAIGNGVIDPKHQFVFSNVLRNLGLVDSKQWIKFQTEESKIRTLLEGITPQNAMMHLGATILNQKNTLFLNVTGYAWQYNFHHTQPPAKYNSEFIKWVERIDIRKALHVGDTVFVPYNWRFDASLLNDALRSDGHFFFDLLDHHYRVLIYTGNLDIVCSYSSIPNLLQHIPHATQLKNAERQKWRDQSGKLAGYVKKSGNLAEVLVRNAGHFSSIDQPQRTRELLEKFTHNWL